MEDQAVLGSIPGDTLMRDPNDVSDFDPGAGASSTPSTEATTDLPDFDPGAGLPQPKQPAEMPGTGAALMQGIRRSFGDVGQTVSGDTGREEETSPAAAPYQLSDLWHPGQLLPKTAYRIGSGAPTTAAGIAGGLTGEALAGPVGGIAGGTIGAAAMSAAQTLGPAFQKELKDTPHDKDGAWDRAVHSSLASGAFSGAGWALFPMKFFQGPVKNTVFQVMGVQPGLSAAHQATENVMHDKPATEGTGEAFGEGVIGSAVPAAGHAAVRGAARAVRGAPPGGGPPPLEDAATYLKQESQRRYGNVENWGVYYTNQDAMRNLSTSIRETLLDAGTHPDEQRSVFRAVDDLARSRRGPTGTIDFQDVNRVRSSLSEDTRDYANPRVQRAGAIALRELDDWLHDPRRQEEAGLHPDLAEALPRELMGAREYWRAYRAAEDWQHLEDVVSTAANPEARRRTLINQLIHDPDRRGLYPPQAIQMLHDSLQPNFWSGIDRFTRRFSPESSTGLITDFMLHHLTGMMGLAAPVSSIGVHHMASRPYEKAVERTPELIRHAPADEPPAPPQLGYARRAAQRTGRAYQPTRVPTVIPAGQYQDQEARGGAIKKALSIAKRGNR